MRVRKGGGEEIPLIQGKEQPCFLRGPPKKEKGRFLYGSEG